MNSEPLPLAEAAARLRGKPGRPRRSARAVAGQASALPAAPPSMRAGARPVAVVWLKKGKGETAEWTPTQARLLDLASAAAYLGVSAWTLRDYVAAGLLARVTLPTPQGGPLKRLLLDVGDLDRLIEEGKDEP